MITVCELCIQHLNQRFVCSNYRPGFSSRTCSYGTEHRLAWASIINFCVFLDLVRSLFWFFWHTCDRTLDGPSSILSRVFSFFFFLVKLRFCFFTVDFKEAVHSLNILLATNDSKKRCIWIDEVLIIEILKNAVCPTVGGGGGCLCCQIVMAECWWMCVWASHFNMVSVIKFTFLENFWRTIEKARSQALVWSSDTQQWQWHTHAK